MIVKSLKLENIRSYGNSDLVIQFSLGVTLFEGDMHAGKSTLLYAIEFALFGLGELKGSFLLRNGCQRGGVTLIFEECGQVYEIHRSLIKKGNSIRQDECYFQGPSGKEVLTPTDLKEKILQILGFNEPVNPKSQSVIYRYAIFTPQEQMKEVMNKDPDSRLQTLRKAFRIEDYKTATENCCILLNRIRNKILVLQGQTQDLDKLKKDLETTIKVISKIDELLTSLRDNESHIIKKMKELETEHTELDKERERLIRIEDKIPIYTEQLKDKEKEIYESNQEISRIKNKLSATRTQIINFKKVRNRSNLSLQELETLNAKLVERIEEFQSIKQLATQADSHIPLLQNALNKLSDDIGIKHDEKIKKEKMAGELEEEITRLNGIRRPTEKSVIVLQQERSELEHNKVEIAKQMSRLDERISNFDLLLENKKCPVCEQSIDSEGFLNKNSHLKKEQEKLKESYDSIVCCVNGLDDMKEELTKFNELNTKNKELNIKLDEVKQDITLLSQRLQEYKKEENNLKDQKRKAVNEASKKKVIQEKIDRYKKKQIRIVILTEALKEYQRAQNDLARLESEENEDNVTVKRLIELVRKLEDDELLIKELINEAKTEIRPLISIRKRLDSLTLDLDEIRGEAQSLGNQISSNIARLEFSTARKRELEDSVAQKEKVLETVGLLSEHRVWLEEYFSVAVMNIEKLVLESHRRHFNNQFQRWFEILVEDPALRVKVDENFTAQISREGFDQDYFQLSGGERTSIALAYRLALNLIVQQVSAGGASNLLILDEPTDGFSKQQLYRLRDVFHELKCPQIILVSHEKELEGFADNIVNVQNMNGMSTVNLN